MSEEQVAYAARGEERALATVVAPKLLRFDALELVAGNGAADLVAAVVLTWSGDSSRAYELFRRASAGAVAERRFALAAAALERLAHHALLFGDVAVAAGAAGDAVAIASEHRVTQAILETIATAARIALAKGDLGAAEDLLRKAHFHDVARLPIACAPVGVAIALERGDAASLRRWSGPPIIEAALHSPRLNEATAATAALLIATAQNGPDESSAIALRRALLAVTDAQNVPEFFTVAARYGDVDDARYALRLFEGCVCPERSYLRAHRLLARAYLAFRTAQYTACTENAGDAARAFSAMGLRRYADEAMALLVRHTGGPCRPRGKPRSTLTQREEQIANLIRRGARNREIASALQISEHTVERHVSSILGRLGLRSRWQIGDTRAFPED